MPTARLSNRAVLFVSGAEARVFLDRLLTCDVDPVVPGRPRFGALLTPQGKILADMVLHQAAGDDEFYLDTARSCAGDLVKRLNLYKLRAKVAVEDRSETLGVVVGWDDAEMPPAAVAAAMDPRLPALGWRAVVDGAAAPDPDGEAAYAAHRIALGIPEAGSDFAFGGAFPHEALMDQFAGVDFDKGCYVGQEVVSRMQHRGTARSRVVPVLYDGEGVPVGTEVKAGERGLGTTGTVSGVLGLATLRLDRVADALAAGESLQAGGHSLRLRDKPDWIRFTWPGEATATGA